MDAIFDEGLSARRAALLAVCLVIAFGFELVNGFHDTANAVATVIYTNTLRPRVAVVLSGLCNFAGVFVGGIAVALGIIHLLPVELLVGSGPGAGLAMVLALLLSAMAWNLGTWYLGLPASSSHALIGSILGVGLANSLLPGHHLGEGVNWLAAREIGLSLLLSPLVGFCLAAILLLIVKRYIRDPALLQAPCKDTPPPLATRGLLIATCSGVSFAHGSNDGQKGVGIVMLILMGLVPQAYALDLGAAQGGVARTLAATAALETTLRDNAEGAAQAEGDRAIAELAQIHARLAGHTRVSEIPRDERFHVRQAILLADKSIERIVETGGLGLSATEHAKLKSDRQALRSLTEYAPTWVLAAIALSLGAGNDGGLEADRGDGGGEDREEPPHLRAGRGGGAGGDEHHRALGLAGVAGEHDARALVRDRRDDGGQQGGAAGEHGAEHRAGLGADAAGDHDAVGGVVLDAAGGAGGGGVTRLQPSSRRGRLVLIVIVVTEQEPYAQLDQLEGLCLDERAPPCAASPMVSRAVDAGLPERSPLSAPPPTSGLVAHPAPPIAIRPTTADPMRARSLAPDARRGGDRVRAWRRARGSHGRRSQAS